LKTGDAGMRILGNDWSQGLWLGRLLTEHGPTPILLRDGRAFDVSRCAPTVADFIGAGPSALECANAREIEPPHLAPAWEREAASRPALLAPVDLQVIKASGVTFAVSAIERVIEERARGDAASADAIRAALRDRVGMEVHAVKPGSEAAARLKQALIADGLWSQYLEVAIGPDAEIFTKAPVLSAVGWGAWVGVRGDSTWNNPEAEIVLICDRHGRIAGATLGNDVNLRDIEGRSALLLGKAKDNNASCAIGPLIRLFDDTFGLDDVRNAELELEIIGEDGFRLSESGAMIAISRDPAELVAQTIGHDHSYPDGFALFLGAMFAPTQDRDAPGLGFTHKKGDLVRIASNKLGVLENRVTTCREAPHWTFGLSDLMHNLAARGLLERARPA
jgi:fumarylacetoacetate (FAA) hydrolase family protein